MFKFFGADKIREFVGSLGDYELAQRICDYEELLKNTLLQCDNLNLELRKMLELMNEIAVARFICSAYDEGLEKEIKEGTF